MFNKIIIVLILSLIAPTGAVSNTTDESRVEVTESNYSIETSTQESITNPDLNLQIEIADSLAQKLEKTEDPYKIEELLEEYMVMKEFEAYYIYYGTSDGIFYITPSTPLPDGYDFRERPVYLNAVEEGMYAPELYMDYSSNRYIQTVSMPIFVDGDLKGVVGIDFFVGE